MIDKLHDDLASSVKALLENSLSPFPLEAVVISQFGEGPIAEAKRVLEIYHKTKENPS